MTDSGTSRSEEPLGLDVLRADDLLLDALGRGERGPTDDGIAALLAAWRTEVVEVAEAPAVAPHDADEAAPDGDELAEVVPITRARRRRRARLGVAAAVLAVVAGGTGIASAQATPGSPLWPITHLVNPDRADLLDAESAIADARKAVTEGRRSDAQRLVDRAASLVSRVRDPGDAARLRTELEVVRHQLATVSGPGARSGAGPSGGGSGAPAPGTGPTPGTTPTPGSGAGQGGGQPAPTPGPTGTGGQPPPPLIPPLPLPTSLPPLPLPTLTILGR
jgi:hypothetical protein